MGATIAPSSATNGRYTNCVGRETTLTPKVVDRVLPLPSLTFRVMVALPIPLLAVTVNVRVDPLPSKRMLFSGTSAGLDEIAHTCSASVGVSASETEKRIGKLEPLEKMVVLLTLDNTGGVFVVEVERTVSTQLSLAVRAPSLTVMLIVAVPVWFVAGVTFTVRLLPLPPKTTF